MRNPIRRTRPSTSILALATVLAMGASPAAAQSLQGSGSFTFGSGTITPGAGTTTISVTSPTAVIDWTPTDNAVGGLAINFQPTGTTATFSSVGDFAVLNRINVADTNRNILLNGTINGLIGATAPVQGGSIYFYSPGGFILGANAVVNVGSFMLSALPVAVDGNGNFLNGTSVVFNQAINTSAIVSTNAGAQINTSNYVAMVAPRIIHNGAINTAGQAALVAAEAATINFSPDGLFDIQVDSGTSVAAAISVGGSISGPSGNGAQGDVNRIFAVAVPKNQLLTLAIGSGATLGFDVAGAADVDGNAIVLSAGHDIVDGRIQSARSAGGGTAAAEISMTNVTTTSALFSNATYNNVVTVTSATTMTGDVFIESDRVARLSALTGGALTLNGNATVIADATNQSTGTPNAGIWAEGGAITVNGFAVVRADAFGQPEGNAAATSVNGGQAFILGSLGGDVRINGDVTLTADAFGGDAISTGAVAGNGTGGSANIGAYDAGSTVTITGSVVSSADGYGGAAFGDNGAGGVGSGGFNDVQATSGTGVSIGGTLVASADGYGGSAQSEVCTSCNGIGGTGLGGSTTVSTTGAGAALSIGSAVTLSTNGLGGAADGNGGSGIGGGSGNGGNGASATANGGTLDLVAGLAVRSIGEGGTSATGNGGNGLGGRAFSGATAGTFTVGGDTVMEATAFGGGSNGNGNGGNATGGQSDNGGSGGTVNYQGNVDILVGGYGGYAEIGNGGAGFGGSGWLDAFGASVQVGGNFFGDAAGFGASGGGRGGSAVGGNIYLVSRSGLSVAGFTSLTVDGYGGAGFGGLGGNGQGGYAQIRAQDGGTLTLDLSTSVSSVGNGGESYAPNFAAGNGTGGQALVQALANSTIDIGDSVTVFADGIGGGGFELTSPSGSGFGGTATISANAGGTVSVLGSLFASANGEAGGVGECFNCGGAPGNGTGGTAQVVAAGASGLVDVGQDVNLTANGYGGLSGVGLGGNGTGGAARVSVSSGGAVTIGTYVDLDAIGYGGQDFSGGFGGDGTGGTAQIFANQVGSSVAVGAYAQLDASGLGGGNSEGPMLGGGDGLGGQALITANAGSIDIDSSAQLFATGVGGSGFGGLGGNGTGGVTNAWTQMGTILVGSALTDSLQMIATGRGGNGYDNVGGNGTGGVNTVEVNGSGAIGVAGSVVMDGSAFGGNGTTGGNALARTTPSGSEIQPDAATIVVRGGGAVTIAGSAELRGDATGGAGTFGTVGGNGGNATAGELDVNPYDGSITVNGLNLSAVARGGDGGAGGNGGNAVGGLFDVLIGVGDPINGVLTTGDVSIVANSYGGAGGAGTSGLVGGNGGNGGDATMSTDSTNQFSANAAGGTINAGTVTISRIAYGGAGGTGGDGSAGAGGNGGAGGSAQGGFVQTGSLSNNSILTSGGGLTMGDMTLDTSVVGGAGGAGGVGTTTGGNGGDGGDAGTLVGASSFFGVRGVVANVGDLTLRSNATGGNGGAAGNGGVAGNGGDAFSGRVAVESRERFGAPGQRGTLVAGDIYGEAIASAGTGATNGLSRSFGGSSFVLYNGDATIGSFAFVIDADTYQPGAYDFIAVVEGNAQVAGDFSFVTSNPLSLYANRGTLGASTITLAAPTFIPLTGNSVLGTEAEPASAPGTLIANSFAITTAGDFVTGANLDSVAAVTITAPGSIATGAISSDARIALDAQSGSIAVGNLNAGQEIDLLGTTGVTAGNLASATFIDVASGGAVAINDATAGQDIVLNGLGGISFNSLTANSVQILSGGGAISGGAINSDSFLFGAADGDIVLGNIDAVGAIELATLGSITVGNATSGEDIILATIGAAGELGGSVTAGNLTAGDSIEVEAGTFAALGNLSAGLVNPSSDPLAAYNIGIVAVSSITTGTIAAASNAGLASPGTINTGNVTVGGIFMALGTGAMSFGSISAGQNLYLADFSMSELGGLGPDSDFDPAPVLAATPVATAGSITINGPVDASVVQAAAGGNITAGAIASDSRVALTAGGSITTGTVTAGDSVRMAASGGNVLVNGDVATPSTILLTATGSVTARDLLAGQGVRVSAGGAVTLRDVAAGTQGAIFAQDGTDVTKNIGPGAPVEIVSGGPIVADDISATGYVGLYSNGSITVDTIGAGHDIIALARNDATFGTIVTPETFTLAGFANYPGLFTPGQTFDPSLLFAIANPASTLGDATFTGTVTTSALRSYVGDATSLQGVNAASIVARSGGLLTINAPLNAPLTTLISGDIDIGANGRINGGANGEVLLQALSDLFVGDGLTGTGYALSNAEFGRINGSLIRITSGGFANVDADTLVGDLTITFGANGNIRSPDGGFEIVTLEETGNALDGTLRVVGDVLASGLGVDNYVGFYTQNFELDAAIGTIALTDAQGALGGTLELFANRIHVADGALLDQLAIDPQFDGYVEELNAPATVQRPEGVLRAGNFEIDFFDPGNGEPFSLLVQNTGTTTLPAGFVFGVADIGDLDGGDGSDLPAGSVNLVINGQVATPGGTLSGVAVRDLLVGEFGTDAFAPQSTINGCLLIGSCQSAGPIDGLPPAINLTPPILALIGSDPLGESLFGNEPDIDDSLPGDIDELSSPIAPPQPLFDTTPLDPSNEVNDPVSGAGNPSLYSLHSDDDDDEDEDQEQKNPAKAPAPADKGGTK